MSISSHRITLQEWQCLTPESPGSTLAEVFLDNETETKRIVQALSQSGVLKIIELRQGLSIRASSYVGRITLGDVQITIQPKVTGAPFIRLLRYAYDLRDLTLQTSAPYNSEQGAFQDLLIHQLVAEVRELIARGLRRRYVRTNDPLASPRGKIDIQRIANQAGTLQATLPCTYHPRLEDCLVNQMLLQGLLLAIRLTNDSTLRIQLYRLAHQLQENVSTIRLDQHMFKRLQHEIDRMTVAYKPAITLIELLFAAEGITLDTDSSVMHLPGFLFDMNLFFQALLSRFLRENLQGYEVRDQYKIHHMMHYDPAHNPKNRPAPKLRPDYVLLQQSNVVAILDAKYRDLWENSLPEHMLYQLATYAMSQSGGVETAILYPTMSSNVEEARIIICDPLNTASRATVVLRPVRLPELDDLIKHNKTMSDQRKRSAYAEQLAFGSVNKSYVE